MKEIRFHGRGGQALGRWPDKASYGPHTTEKSKRGGRTVGCRKRKILKTQKRV